jgi:hypothetical protein
LYLKPITSSYAKTISQHCLLFLGHNLIISVGNTLSSLPESFWFAVPFQLALYSQVSFFCSYANLSTKLEKQKFSFFFRIFFTNSNEDPYEFLTNYNLGLNWIVRKQWKSKILKKTLCNVSSSMACHQAKGK